MKLYKTTIVIWSTYNPENCELVHLAHDVDIGASYCSKQESNLINDVTEDSDWDNNEFFEEL